MIGGEEWGGVAGKGEEDFVKHGGSDLSAVRKHFEYQSLKCLR